MGSIQRVVISSTSYDLRLYREHAKEACLKQGMFPVMMEHLPASPADAVEVSLQMVEDADIFIGIYAQRYGYVPPDYSTSITEMEYDAAVKLGIPMLIFVSGDSQVEQRSAEDSPALEQQGRFREKVLRQKVVNFFASPEELYAQILHSLSSFRAQPRPRGATAGEQPVAAERFSEPIRMEMERLNKALDKLTQDQYKVIDFLAGHRRVAITGCAGSGKTLIAAEKAIRLAHAGIRTLLLCHSPFLAEYIHRLVAGTQVTVYDFAMWVAMLGGRDLLERGHWSHYSEPTDDDLTVAFDTLVESEQHHYDAVIVDEGQDFRDEWWLIVEAALKNAQEDILYIFHDNNQALLPHRSKYPIVQSPFTLSQNCRNAGEIFRVVHSFHYRLPQSALPEMLASTGVARRYVFEVEQKFDVLEQAINEALDVLKPEQLVVLTTEEDPVEASMLFDLEMVVHPKWHWQTLVNKHLTHLAAVYEYTRKPPRLSTALVPQPDDVEVVRAYALCLIETPSAKKQGKPQPERVARVRWGVTRDGLQLYPTNISDRRMAWFYATEAWEEGIPAPDKIRLTPRATPTDGLLMLPLFTVSTFKGLEADGIILFVPQPRDHLRTNLYVGTSRARLLLHIVTHRQTQGYFP